MQNLTRYRIVVPEGKSSVIEMDGNGPLVFYEEAIKYYNQLVIDRLDKILESVSPSKSESDSDG